MERRKNILSLPTLDGDTDSPSVILYKNKVYVDSTGAGYKEIDNGRVALKRITPPRATTALSVSELAFDGGTPDIIQYEGASYVKADLNALEKLVGDLLALGDIPEPVATGASCALIAERIKRAIGVWE